MSDPNNPARPDLTKRGDSAPAGGETPEAAGQGPTYGEPSYGQPDYSQQPGYGQHDSQQGYTQQSYG